MLSGRHCCNRTEFVSSSGDTWQLTKDLYDSECVDGLLECAGSVSRGSWTQLGGKRRDGDPGPGVQRLGVDFTSSRHLFQLWERDLSNGDAAHFDGGVALCTSDRERLSP